jgi:hypothetical protein
VDRGLKTGERNAKLMTPEEILIKTGTKMLYIVEEQVEGGHIFS